MISAELDKAYQQAKHQLEIEGFTLTDEDEQNMKAVVSGEMSREQLIEQLKRV
ncbi:antitoxin VbhA family protein (plasmid) [Alkalibacillus sp. S2W]|uniref:Antitoxin VbhA domain-containing protein n=1 Tax=Alkalibacillus flavidus TaxID=546021 RepID=A0ABV2L101_9BACI